MTLPFRVVDVFADRAFAGNPLAVVLDADELTTEQMQSLAREFNLSETTFPVRTSAEADYRLRIFTPTTELPFAGHPSVGTAWVMAELGRVQRGRIIQECGAGLLPVDVDVDGAVLTGGPPVHGDALDPEPLLGAAGLTPADLAGGPPPRAAGTGISFAYLPVHPDAVARAEPDTVRLRSLHIPELYVFSYDGDASTAHSRMFGGGVGVVEDPATGSAALGLGVWLAVSGLVAPDATTAYRVDQGAEIGRPSRLECAVTTENGLVVRTTVAGRVVPVAEGTIVVPAG
ncbi:MAG: trans-2,3-dihydro-3-hydroxyanthranilate isomerase [Frankiales bacterium]|nr:trans-2,3-dihydro-3-hydroxyanthranilate isomerase [Frankiales bacterium]